MAVVSNGTTVIDAGALGTGAGAGKMTLIKTLTASSSSTLSFVDGAASVVLDDTFDSYLFKFINIHPASNNVDFQFNMSADAGGNYNVTKTSSFFQAERSEAGGGGLAYSANDDLAQDAGFQNISDAVGTDNDASSNGILTIFNPSSTVFMKHFTARLNGMYNSSYIVDCHSAGYANTTSAVDAVQFKFSSGAIASGVIKLYGIGG